MPEQIPDHQPADRQADQGDRIVPENGIEGVADEIDRQNADREPASPLGFSGQSDRGQAAAVPTTAISAIDQFPIC